MTAATVAGSAPSRKVLLVDLGNVLVRFDHHETARRLSVATGVDPDVLMEALHGPDEALFDAGRISRTDFFRAVERRAGTGTVPDEVWVPAWRDVFEPVPEALALVGSVRTRARVALVSNTNELHWEGVLRVAEIESRVDALVLSFRVGSCKPSPEIFRAALEALGASAEDAVFADDRPEHLAGAAALGIDGILVDGPASLAAGLGRAGLIPAGRSPEPR